MPHSCFFCWRKSGKNAAFSEIEHNCETRAGHFCYTKEQTVYSLSEKMGEGTERDHLEETMERYHPPALSTEPAQAPATWLRVCTFGRFQIEWVDPATGERTPLPAERMQGQNAGTALSLFKALLTRPDRFATRSWLLEQFWPESRQRAAEERLNDVVSALRTLLRPPGCTQRLVHFVYGANGRGAGYRLDAYPQLWCDADAFAWYVTHALLLERRGQDSTLLWERASALAARGEYLPEQIEDEWSQQQREYLSGLRRDCVHRWTEVLRQRGCGEEAIVRLRDYWLSHPTDEDALRPLLELLGERERFGEAEEVYAKAQAALAEDGCEPDTRTIETMEVVRALQIRRSAGTLSSLKAQGTPCMRTDRALPNTLDVDQTIPLFQARGGYLFSHSRRMLLQHLIGMTGAALLPDTYLPDLETLERLSHALRSSDIDEITLMGLEKATQDHRSTFVYSDGKTWQTIFQEMSGHLRVLTHLLERHAHHAHLRTIAGETALLLGDLLFNAGENAAADAYYQGAFTVCEGNPLLQAVILGRESLIPLYNQRPERALQFIDQAQQLVPPTAADLLVAWLWAVKAEAYASAGETSACSQALLSAERLLERERQGEITFHFLPEIAYATFNQTKFSGYKGACLLRLRQAEAAQNILRDQLTLVEQQGQIHHQSIALVDLATSCVQQAAIRQACDFAAEALACLEQTCSIRVFQRLLIFRSMLNPWENVVSVKHLDERLSTFASALLRGVS
jgi:DNA-binding SARP family transcriptional activator